MNKALWHISKHESELHPVPGFIHKTNTNKLKIKTLFSLISTGTEKTIAAGQVPPLLYDSMRVNYMEGDFNFPIKYGYSLVGKIISEGKHYGKTVHAMHPHQEIAWVEEKDISVLADSIPLKRATLISNLETALNAIWDSKVSMGDKVLMVGFGMIGALVARLLQMIGGVDVFILEKNNFRNKMAIKMGFKLHEDTSKKRDFDISFHTTASANGLQKSIDSVGKEGRIIELSWYGTKEIKLSLGMDFHSQRKKIISSQVSQIPSFKSARWDYQRRKKVVIKLLENPIFDQHITHLIPFNDAPLFFKKLRKNQLDEGLGWCFKY